MLNDVNKFTLDVVHSLLHRSCKMEMSRCRNYCNVLKRKGCITKISNVLVKSRMVCFIPLIFFVYAIY